MEQPETLLHCFLDLGEAMLAAGADVNRVEDTLTRLGRAYGAVRMDVFVITSSIVVTMSLPDGRDVTQTRRILTPGGTDLTILEDLNALSRRCCTCPLTVKRLRAEITALTQCTAKPLWVFAGSALGAGSCTVFFGGSIWDGLSAAAFGLAICWLQRHFSGACPNRLVFNLLAAMAVGITELFSLTPLLTCGRTGFILAAGCAGWGGLSVLCQTAAVLDGTDLSSRPCFLGKLMQGHLSALMAAALSLWLFP